jgi:hypothetical protein
MCKSAVFWQTERYLTVFPTGTEKKDILGFFGLGWYMGKGNGACIGLISPKNTDSHIPGVFDGR